MWHVRPSETACAKTSRRRDRTGTSRRATRGRIAAMSRRLVVVLGTLVVLAAVLLLAFRLALAELHGAVEGALGPRGSVGGVSVGWTGIELRDVRIRAERGGKRPWPADDELRAARVHVVPDVTTLWSRGWRVSRVTITDGFVSVLRSRDGKLRLLPSLLETPAPPAAGAGRTAASTPVRIAGVTLANAEVEFLDASVRQPPHRMRLERLEADVGPLHLPALDQPVNIELAGVFKGPRRDGRLGLKGWLTPATRDAKIAARFSGVDLIALQPYLLRVSESGVRRGTIDLTLNAKVAKNRLHAPGTVTLTGLELAGGSFAGLPRQAVIAAMSRDGRIEVDFTLEGRLDDPRFSLNETIAVKLAGGLAESLGVSIGGVVEGLGSVVKGLLGR